MVGFELKSDFIVIAQGGPLPTTTGIPPKERNLEILSNDLALMVGVGILALLVLAFFAKQSFGNGSRRRKRVSESRSVPDSSSLPRISSPQEVKRKGGHKRRRQKRSHRPSNPTIGETGGLPPQKYGNDTSDHSRS